MVKYSKLVDTNFFKNCRLVTTNRQKHIRIREMRMNLYDVEEGKEYIISEIKTDDEELNSFLFSLGCYSGEPITVVSRKKSGCVVSIKDSRYSIDSQLAKAIIVF